MSIDLVTSLPQITTIFILGSALLMFLQNKVRYDIIAILVMLAIIASGTLSYQEVFANFGHQVIIIIASMFIMSEAFVRSGLVDSIVGRLTILHNRPILSLAFLVLLVAFLSAFINNAGALAMSIPIAIHLAKKSKTSIAFFLLPLAFASHLGGFTTLIGTPRNILISDFRYEASGVAFQMFDFFHVGGFIALLGIIFLITISWRLIPVRKKSDPETVVEKKYLTEVNVPQESKVSHMSIKDFEHVTKDNIKVVNVYRGSEYLEIKPGLEINQGDSLILKGTLEYLTENIKKFKLGLTGMRAKEKFVTNEDDYTTLEVIVPPYTKIIGNTWNNIPLQKRFGTNFIGIHRREDNLNSKISETTIWPNDILVLHGRSASLQETIKSLNLMQIANPEISFGRDGSAIMTIAILTLAIAIATTNILPLAVIFLTTSILLIVLKLITLRQAYESIDQTVLILLAGMITLGDALLKSGTAESIANFMLLIDNFAGPVIMLIIVLIVSMLLADFMNSTASTVVMAPIAIVVAQSMMVSIDPFLIAVAIGASSAFLTPIGHESNAIVMRQGGYSFRDYSRVGLPLEILIVLASVPLILHFWAF